MILAPIDSLSMHAAVPTISRRADTPRIGACRPSFLLDSALRLGERRTYNARLLLAMPADSHPCPPGADRSGIHSRRFAHR